jgi:hypothetical protein
MSVSGPENVHPFPSGKLILGQVLATTPYELTDSCDADVALSRCISEAHTCTSLGFWPQQTLPGNFRQVGKLPNGGKTAKPKPPVFRSIRACE